MASEKPITTLPVRIIEHRTAQGRVLIQAELNSESTLNALTLEMIDLIAPLLETWASRDDVAAVIFTGAGSKAFCAGGDIQALYHAIKRNHQAGRLVDSYALDFFGREYRMDYQIHRFPKPLIVLGHGVVMGGGLGIFSGAAIRIITERSRVAIPEVGIGLFPDAGGTWLLRNMPLHLAIFIGVTGCHLNAADVQLLGLRTHTVPSENVDKVIPTLAALELTGVPVDDEELIRHALDALPDAQLPESQLVKVPHTLSLGADFMATINNVRELHGLDSWIDKGIDAMNAGCATSVGVVLEQIRRAPALSLAECFQLEYNVASHCAQYEEFAEGVRALLIDKDGSPKWRYPDLDSLDTAHVAEHFTPEAGVHPLSDLENHR